MSQTVRRCVEGRLPPCYNSNRLEARRAKARSLRLERQRKPDKPEDFVCYSDSESEEDTPSQQQQILRSSYNFVDFVRSREIQNKEARFINSSYASRHILTHDMFKETPVNLGNINKVFCSQWLSDRQVVFGTKCNKLMVYDVNTRQLDVIPTLRSRHVWAAGGHQPGIHSVEINPSRTLLATGAQNSCEIAVYRLPTLDPVCVGEAHRDWVLDMCWLDDQFFVSGCRDTKMALWRIQCEDNDDEYLPPEKPTPSTSASTSSGANPPSSSSVTTTSEPAVPAPTAATAETPAVPLHKCISPVVIKECRSGQKVRAITFNKRWKEIAALTLNGYIHVFNAETFKQKISRKLPSCQDLVCLATQESGLYAIGCKSYTLLLDCRTLQSVKKITSRYNGCGIRSASFQGDMLTIGTGLGMLMFYDLRAGKYLESHIHTSKTVVLKASKGYVFPDEEADGFNQVKYVPAIYTHCYDATGTRIFTAGGPLPATLIGNYAGLWQ